MGNLLVEVEISIDTREIKRQKKVEKVTLEQALLVFGTRVYNITYKCAGSTSDTTLFQAGSEYGLSKKADGVYPTFYCEGTTPAISDLKSSFSCGEGYHSGGGVCQSRTIRIPPKRRYFRGLCRIRLRPYRQVRTKSPSTVIIGNSDVLVACKYCVAFLG